MLFIVVFFKINNFFLQVFKLISCTPKSFNGCWNISFCTSILRKRFHIVRMRTPQLQLQLQLKKKTETASFFDPLSHNFNKIFKRLLLKLLRKMSQHITIRIAVRAVRIFPARPRPKMALFDRGYSFFKFFASLEFRNKRNNF